MLPPHDHATLPGAPLAPLIGAALAMLLVSMASEQSIPGHDAVSLFLPASGVALALVLCSGLALLPGIGAGLLLAGALTGQPLAHTLAQTLSTVVAVGIAGRRLRRESQPSRSGMTWHLLVWACGIGAGAGALAGSALMWLDDGIGHHHHDPEGLHFAQAWMGQALGFLLVTPLALSYRRALIEPLARARWREGALLWPLAAAASSIIFGHPHLPWLAPLANAYWMFLFVGWSGMRLGLLPTTALLCLIALQAQWGTSEGIGFFANDVAATWGFGYWSYMMILGVLGLALASYMTDLAAARTRQRQADDAQRDALVREVHHRIKNNLQGVVGMLRTLAQRHPRLHQDIRQMSTQVQGIAIVHGLQGGQSTEDVDLGELLHAIAHGVSQAFGATLHLTHAPPSMRTRLSRTEAVPVALVLNELMTNAIKHGGPARAADVALRQAPAEAVVTLSNPGPWAQGADASALPAGHGLDLVQLLLPRRGARLTHHAQAGRVVTTLTLTPPVIYIGDD